MCDIYFKYFFPCGPCCLGGLSSPAGSGQEGLGGWGSRARARKHVCVCVCVCVCGVYICIYIYIYTSGHPGSQRSSLPCRVAIFVMTFCIRGQTPLCPTHKSHCCRALHGLDHCLSISIYLYLSIYLSLSRPGEAVTRNGVAFTDLDLDSSQVPAPSHPKF